MNCHTTNGAAVPGGIYLCQVDRNTSCGACCGLYNLADISRKMLSKLLNRRTVEFASVPRNIAAIDAFAAKETAQLPEPKPFSDFHHCPYIGFIGSTKNRVGCLLHPMAEGNNGVDYRGMSYYGGMACRDYFCPATRNLAPEIKIMLRNLDADWYIYGLVVTEVTLHQALFAEMEKQTGGGIDSALLDKDDRFTRWCSDLLTLKLNWPFRDPDRSLCHYLFDDSTHQRPAIDYNRLNVAPSRLDTILRELNSHFASKKDLAEAEFLLDQLFHRKGINPHKKGE